MSIVLSGHIGRKVTLTIGCAPIKVIVEGKPFDFMEVTDPALAYDHSSIGVKQSVTVTFSDHEPTPLQRKIAKLEAKLAKLKGEL